MTGALSAMLRAPDFARFRDADALVLGQLVPVAPERMVIQLASAEPASDASQSSLTSMPITIRTAALTFDSIIYGTIISIHRNITEHATRLHQAARAELLDGGVKIGEVFHGAGDVHAGTDEPYLSGTRRLSGADPARSSYGSFASFKDPDGNGWLFQEITARLPGRVDASDTTFTSSTRCGARRPRMASMRSGPAASTMRTGRTGTPTTSSRSRPARNCRHKRCAE